MAETFRVLEYFAEGKSPFAEWFSGLDSVTAARVDRYVRRLEAGNFGAAKSLRDGVFELRLDFGPGYRVYLDVRVTQLSFCWAGGRKGGRTPTF